ncbi:uncharacterized protein A1O5_04337 [Cladophialophora psammophila CBS 110553]|uniref:SnoaL-like domain-containing protein n=1 Tax=Cladophialophora psammophila CBS 110553 TaxID=1182543 RepID=W9X4L1_9EURO|nr:uncharacterized protein A1O5_04337 [Cladophialophora psammophila CBS 110553]EXJ71836.1 hypothetical protein A1O5_04337 [Cladophialophora psammophila CBS 110553]
MSAWLQESQLVNIDDVHAALCSPVSKHHDPTLKHVEQELLDHLRDFLDFVNVVCVNDPDAGKKYYDLTDSTDFDLMGQLHRPGFEKHYDHITPYLADANVAFKDVEIFAVTPDFGYITYIQHFKGTSSDKTPFDFTFRATSVLRKIDGHWKYIHEHFSFPVNMANKQADTTSGQSLSDNVEFNKSK